MKINPEHQSAWNVEQIVEALDIGNEFKARFRVPRVKINSEWETGTLSAEAFQRGRLELA